MTAAFAGTQKQGEKLPTKQFMLELFETGYLSDVTLKIGREVIKVHRSILSSKSTWFKRKFEVDLIDTKASTELLVIIIDTIDDKEALAHIAVIRFLYSGEFPVANLSSINGKTENRAYLCDFYHAAMIWAYKHGVNDAFDHCGQRYAESLSQLLDNSRSVCVFDGLSALFARGYHHEDMERAFRTVALKSFKQQIERLQKAGRFEEAIRRMKQNPEATADLFNGLRNEDGEIKPTTEWKCSGCEAVFRYSKEPEQHALELPVCPCCTKTRKRGLQDGPLPEQKKAKVKS